MTFRIPGLPLKLSNSLRHTLDKVENRLFELAGGIDEEIDIRTSYLAQAGGKRLRPALVAVTAMLNSEAKEISVVNAGVLVELTHLASLYHDDVMDEAPIRRGAAAAHKVFGNSQAILAGDLLFARASEVAVQLGLEVVDMHAKTFSRLCAGQLHETIGVQDGMDPIAHHLQVLADKTGSITAASARYGAMIAKQSLAVQDALSSYGELMGVAFQIADDVIDLSADPNKTGKTPGTDLREGVPTLPVLFLRQAEATGELDSEGKEIIHLIEHEDLYDDKVLAQVVRLLREHPVTVKTKIYANKLVTQAIEKIEVLEVGPVRKALETFAKLMVDREK